MVLSIGLKPLQGSAYCPNAPGERLTCSTMILLNVAPALLPLIKAAALGAFDHLLDQENGIRET
jgi:hypothetical protein